MPKILSRPAWMVMTLLSLVVALTAYRYPLNVGPLAPNVVANLFARPFLDLHVAGAATALLIAPFQVLPGLRARRPGLHRVMGRIYVAGCLAGGMGGLVLAFGSTAGPIATAGFGLLALAWLATTVQAWRMALARRVAEHRAWMIRSMALTLAAVTLRLYLPFAALGPIPFFDAYRAIAFLCWVPNLLLAEVWLKRRGLASSVA
ncbi:MULTISPECIES: DUF2306 domain-containing protein [Caulobacter]|jgi:uncharacterized membrane protein|uniref:Membrane protein (DUF2306) n=1 Tax=Caulobacter vibrioides OR37 TaxID=1292034 RepID=R0EHN5_CAUVI|nr:MULTISPECIES: DUF2306 domain-containing protein [Caulobacter]ENZ80702.1 hypothetical protein OR37_03420 [Caulobacter vibrioides OR37]MBQ1560835.1 DUF2306 domain-containing protein [Caulobacter sp.]